MQFAFNQDELSKEELDAITEMAIKHCADSHCTCDAVFELQPAGLVVEEDRISELVGLLASHSKQCYASGRNN